MLLEMAMADAYGVGFEFRPQEYVEAYGGGLDRYHVHQRYKLMQARYSDDTQMSLALAELAISGEAWTTEAIADAFVQVYRRDPRDGYSGRLVRALAVAGTGQELIASLDVNSWGNGAAMRAGVVGLYADATEVIARSELQAKVTHDTEEAVGAAQAAALETHYVAYGLGARGNVGDYIAETLSDGRWAEPWRGRVGSVASEAVRASITALASSATQAELLRKCVAYGGDVDTVAAIAMAAASLSHKYKADLPQALVTGLEDGEYGRSYLDEVDRLLAKRFYKIAWPEAYV